MTLEELIADTRERVFDLEDPPNISDEKFKKWANEAERQAARRARLIVDSTTAACCQISLLAGTAAYALHRKVLFVRGRIRLATAGRYITRIHRDDLAALGPEWVSETGDIERFCPNLNSRSLTFYRIPTAATADTAHLTVVRMPLVDMEDDGDEPEILEHLHEFLVDWMEHRYFTLCDPELRDKAKADAALARFTAQFGPESTAIDEAWIQEQHDYDEGEGLF